MGFFFDEERVVSIEDCVRNAALRRAAGFTPAVGPHGGGERRRSLNRALIAQQSIGEEMLPTTDQARGGSEPLPKQIGRYHILEWRGAGGMGTVYKAHDPQLDRVVALKLPRFASTEGDLSVRRQRFQREARAAAQVWHPHVCPIFDVGDHNGQPFVVMAYLEGQSLAERLAEQGRFENMAEAVIFLRQVLDALHAVHACGIIHRDLKPGNIMIDPMGRPILTDFGLARPELDAEHLTSDGLIVGTPAYMAPEQAAGQAERIGPWTDLYSLGVMFYQMLTGRLPFEGPGLTIFAKIMNETASAPSSLRPELPGDLDTIVLTAMAKVERNRYQQARQFDADLAVWCQKHPSAGGSATATGMLPFPQHLAAGQSSQDAAPISTLGAEMAFRSKVIGGSILGAVVFVLILIVGFSTNWRQGDFKEKVRHPKKEGQPPRTVVDDGMKQGGDKKQDDGKENPEDVRRKRNEEDLAVRLEAALTIRFQTDKDEALAKVAGEAAEAGFDKLVMKGIAAIGPLNKDDAATDCAARLSKGGHKKAALKVAQMIGNFFKRDAALKKVALEPN
jgi:tRNA A-37 threonylcarbamoyl transferase component Bud32